MALPTASDNNFPKVLLDMQTSTPAAPSNEDWKLYAKPDGIYARSSNSIVGPFAASSGAGMTNPMTTTGDMIYSSSGSTPAALAAGSNGTHMRSTGTAPTWESNPTVLNRLTSGDVTISATTNVFASNITGLGDITLAAAAGDWIEVGASAMAPNTTAQSMKLDVCTVVSAAAVNFLSNGSSTSSGNGNPAWYMTASVIAKAGGTIMYRAQPGDITGGTIVLRLLCFVSASTRVLGATTAQPCIFWARNLR